MISAGVIAAVARCGRHEDQSFGRHNALAALSAGAEETLRLPVRSHEQVGVAHEPIDGGPRSRAGAVGSCFAPQAGCLERFADGFAGSGVETKGAEPVQHDHLAAPQYGPLRTLRVQLFRCKLAPPQLAPGFCVEHRHAAAGTKLVTAGVQQHQAVGGTHRFEFRAGLESSTFLLDLAQRMDLFVPPSPRAVFQLEGRYGPDVPRPVVSSAACRNSGLGSQNKGVHHRRREPRRPFDGRGPLASAGFPIKHDQVRPVRLNNHIEVDNKPGHRALPTLSAVRSKLDRPAPCHLANPRRIP